MRKDMTYLCHLSEEKLQKMQHNKDELIDPLSYAIWRHRTSLTVNIGSGDGILPVNAWCHQTQRFKIIHFLMGPWDPQTMILMGPSTGSTGHIIDVCIRWKF